MRRRIYCETLPLEELTRAATVALLARFGVHPVVAVWPSTLAGSCDAFARLAGAGLRPVLWPMLSDAGGRWLGADNAEAFARFVGEARAATDAREVLLDLEPPIEKLRAALAMKGLPFAADLRGFSVAKDRVRRLVDDLHASEVVVTAAIPPPALLEGFEPLLGTPVAGVAWDSVTPMLYASIAEGWSAGALRREDARAFVAWGARAAALRFGQRAGASLGAVGVGALGDEPVYRSVAELADDVAIALGAGATDLTLFELGGVLRRPPAEAWLEAFTETASAAPSAGADLPATWRMDALVRGAGLVAHASRLLARLSLPSGESPPSAGKPKPS